MSGFIYIPKNLTFFTTPYKKHYEKFADGSIQEIDVPYDIPENWEWAKLGSIGIWNSGATPPKSNCSYYSSSTIPWLLTGDLTDSYITNIPNKISELALKETSVKVNPTGSILIAMYGATVGKLGILTFPATTNQACCACSKLFQIEKLYLFYFLMAERNNFKFRAEGGAQPNISKIKIINTFIPLPPLSEQQRIVEAIESALEKVDEYAESYNRLEQLDKEFPDKLKKSILQYAMQGKLVDQDPNDESVEVLLEKIRAEKQKLFEEGKIKKKDLEESIVYQGDDNSYYGNKDGITSYPIYEIPEAWRYIKFASLVNFKIGKTPPRSEATFWGTEIPWVSISDMPISGYVTNTRESISKLALKSKKIDISPKGTLLMSFKLSIGKVAILDIPATHNEAIISIFPYANKENIIRDYLMIFLPLISTLGDSKDAIKGKTLNSSSISELLVPISSHEEMKRIISKVDLLFRKVSQLSE